LKIEAHRKKHATTPVPLLPAKTADDDAPIAGLFLPHAQHCRTCGDEADSEHQGYPAPELALSPCPVWEQETTLLGTG